LSKEVRDLTEKTVSSNGAFCIWLTGLSASGKTTLAQMLGEALARRGFKVKILDGDIVRNTLSKGLGFSRADRETNLRRIARMAQNLVRQQIVTIVAAICPYNAIREEVRSIIGELVEIYVNCPLEVCISRDPKGLYQRALSGKIQNFTGIGDVFDIPLRPEIEVTTDAETPKESLTRILCGLEELRRILPEAVDPLKNEEEDLPESWPNLPSTGAKAQSKE
jgi:adenylylsulfate kinase